MRRNLYIGFGVFLIIAVIALVAVEEALYVGSILIIAMVGVAIYDVLQRKHAILRNFPVLGHIRYILEFFRPEVQQYFIASDQEEKPFDRETRTLVYSRAKKSRETLPFGTQRELAQQGYQWVQHSMAPIHISEVNQDKVKVGGKQCERPYYAQYLNISAMSFGALSKHAILALNKGAQKGGFYHNTGEGGISPFHLEGGGDLVFQVGTGYFGCRDKDGNFDANKFQEKASLESVKMIEIKISQGAKPGHGGILPGIKVDRFIADIRGIEQGKDCISNQAHTAFDSPIGLLHFIQELRELSGGKPVGFKVCLGKRSEFLGICKAMLKSKILPDFITVDGAEGGTGAAPVEFIDHVGALLNDALVYVHNALVGIGLRDKIRIIASGKVATGFDMVSKLALGADLCNSARGFMMSLGCIQSLQCNANSCPTGVATQNKRLIKGLVVSDKFQRVYNFQQGTVDSFFEIVGAMGLNSPADLSPEYVFKRDNKGMIQSYAEVYPYIKSGALVIGEIPRYLSKHWAQAHVDKF